MTAVDWTQVDEGYRRGAYEITPVGPYEGRGWLLRSVEGVRRFVMAGPAGLQYESLNSAKNFASHFELESVRRAKQIRHAVLGLPCMGLAIALLGALGSITEDNRFMFGATALVLLFIGLREAVYFQAAIATGSDYYYQRHRLGYVDRFINRAVMTLVTGRPRRRSGPASPVEGAVEIMLIDLDDFRYPGG